MAFHSDLEAYLRDAGYNVVERGSATPKPPAIIVRSGGVIFTDRGVKDEVLVDVLATYDTGKDADDVLQTMIREVGNHLWDWSECLPQRSNAPVRVSIKGSEVSLLVSTIVVEQI